MLDGDSLANSLVFILTTTPAQHHQSNSRQGSAMQLSLDAVTSSSLQSHLLQSIHRRRIIPHSIALCIPIKPMNHDEMHA